MDDCEARLTRPPEPLAWVFGAMGLLNGLFIDEVSRALVHGLRACDLGPALPSVHLELHERAVFAVVFGLCFFVAGAALSRSLHGGAAIGFASPCSLALAAFIAGVMGLPLSNQSIQLAGVGMLVGLPAGALATFGATRAWEARAHTTAHRLFRRVMVLAVVIHGVTMVARMSRRALEEPGLGSHDDHALVTFVVLGVVGVVMLAKTLLDLRNLRLLEQRLEANERSAKEPVVEDLGLGDEELEIMALGKNPYRDTNKLLASVRGDIDRVFRALQWGGAGLAVVTVVMAMSLLVPLSHPFLCV